MIVVAISAERQAVEESLAKSATTLVEGYSKIIASEGASGFAMGFGAALITFALAMEVRFGDIRIAHVTTADFIAMVLSGVALVALGIVYRLLQLRTAVAGAEKAAGLLEKAAEMVANPGRQLD